MTSKAEDRAKLFPCSSKSSCLLCCFKKQKRTGFCHRVSYVFRAILYSVRCTFLMVICEIMPILQPVEDDSTNRKSPSATNSVNSNLNGNRNCFTLGYSFLV